MRTSYHNLIWGWHRSGGLWPVLVTIGQWIWIWRCTVKSGIHGPVWIWLVNSQIQHLRPDLHWLLIFLFFLKWPCRQIRPTKDRKWENGVIIFILFIIIKVWDKNTFAFFSLSLYIYRYIYLPSRRCGVIFSSFIIKFSPFN